MNFFKKSEIKSPNFIKIFWFLILVGVSLRLLLSTLGHNFDLESYWIVSDLVLKDKSVYAETARYNYGPIWFMLLGIFRRITIATGFDDIIHFHIIIAAFLTLIDAIIALFLRDKYGTRSSIFFFLNPVSILITGYHSQFDNVAILLGLLACFYLSSPHKISVRRTMVGSFILGLSIATKHILLFFPLWLWWSNRASKISIRISLLAFSYGAAAICLLPFCLDKNSINGVYEHVIQYSSIQGETLISSIPELFLNLNIIEQSLCVPLSKGLFLLILIISAMIWVSSQRQTNTFSLLFLYLITLVCFASSMADQYLSIPIVALAVYMSAWSWIYSFAAVAVLLTSSSNIFAEYFLNSQVHGYQITQICLLCILLVVFRHDQIVLDKTAVE